MFVYLDNNQFLVNTNCPTVVLVKYIKTRLGLAESGMYSFLLCFIHQEDMWIIISTYSVKFSYYQAFI